MMMRTAVLMLALACGLSASTFTYDVAVNTAALAGTTGTLYFQFNPGDVSSDAALARILNFSGATVGGAPSFSGDASGSLPPSLSIGNTSSNNDALQAVSFGAGLSFRLVLTETFTGTASTGSVFNFGVYRDDGVTPLLTTQADGYSVIVNLDTFNRAVAASTTSAATVSAVPEPGTFLLLSVGFIGILARGKKKGGPFGPPC